MRKHNNKALEKGMKYVQIQQIKRPERRHWRRTGIFIANFEHINFLLLTFWFLILTSKYLLGRVQFLLCESILKIFPDNLLSRHKIG